MLVARPFGAAFQDFSGLDLRALRDWHARQNETETWWDFETGEYEEIRNFSAVDEANGLFRYRLVVMSNFLTLNSSVDTYRQELQMLFRDLRPGAIAIVLGATGDAYQHIYGQVADLAVGAGLIRGPRWDTDDLGRADETAAQRIKLCQYRVYQHLVSIIGDKNLQKDNAWPDYWSPVPSQRARPQFALRVFRKGRWPGVERSHRPKDKESPQEQRPAGAFCRERSANNIPESYLS